MCSVGQLSDPFENKQDDEFEDVSISGMPIEPEEPPPEEAEDGDDAPGDGDAVYDLEPFLLSGMEVGPGHGASRHGQQLAHRPLVREFHDARVLAGDRVVHHRPGRERAADRR